MALAGTGAILIWNGITDEGRDDFYDWHIHEHIPERVAIDGFLRGRRYIAATPETQPVFFTLYETVDIDVTTSAPYLARLDAPTDWTRRATAHFRETKRALTRVAGSAGPGDGGVLATIRFADSAEGRALMAQAVGQRAVILERIGKLSQISGVHLCTTNTGASLTRTAESKDRTDIQAPPIGALLVEGCNLQPLRVAVDAFHKELALPAGAYGTELGYYRLEYLRSK
jgi:hypothetical protein